MYDFSNYFSYCVLIDYEIRDKITLKGVDRMIKFKVKVMLAQKEMTQKDLAEKTGIRPPTVSAICTGSVKHLPVEALNKICAVLECQPADIMEYIPDEDGVQ